MLEGVLLTLTCSRGQKRLDWLSVTSNITDSRRSPGSSEMCRISSNNGNSFFAPRSSVRRHSGFFEAVDGKRTRELRPARKRDTNQDENVNVSCAYGIRMVIAIA